MLLLLIPQQRLKIREGLMGSGSLFLSTRRRIAVGGVQLAAVFIVVTVGAEQLPIAAVDGRDYLL